MPAYKNLVGQIHDVVHQVQDQVYNATNIAKRLAGDKVLDNRYVDLVVQFIGASGLPKMDVVGTADPYFVAKLDQKLSFV